ncbi:MAG: hypothetical protein K9J25_03670 [Bacteroidales bacterium]|nr:hypothetical protein [Bacteroidales bacterium]
MPGRFKCQRYLYNALLCFVLLIVPLNTLTAQEIRYGTPLTEYISRRDYNAASQNWKITQSHNDLLYFANNDGVLEYDGVRWKLYNEMGSFVTRSVKSLGDRIYAGTYNELGYFKYKDNHELEYTSLVGDEELRTLGDYWNIHEWNEYVVFHSEMGICFFKNDSLVNIIPAISRFTSSYLVNDMLLLHDETEGLMEVRGDNLYPVSGGGILKDKIVTSLMPISEDSIVIGTMKTGLFIWDMQRISEWEVPANDMLKKSNIFCGTSYFESHLVFGTIQSGVIITDKSGNIIFQVDKDKGLNNNTVLSLMVDDNGNVWAGLDNGIAKISLGSAISFMQRYYDLGTGYVVRQRNNTWYLGTNQGLFAINDTDFTDPLKGPEDFKKVDGANGQVWSLYNTGHSLLCGHNLGVLSVRGQTAELITPSTVNGVWLFREIPGKDNLLIAGTYNGLILLEKIDGKWGYKTKVKGFNESSRYIEWDNDDLWISHGYKGVFRLRFNDEFTEVTDIKTFAADKFSNDNSSQVLTKVDDELIISSNTALYRITESDTVEYYNDLDDYFRVSYPDRMIQDRYKNIWYFFNGSAGVLRPMEDGSYKNIRYPFIPLKNKLVPSFESVYVKDRNNIIFGVEDGFSHYSVMVGIDYSMPFTLHLREFREIHDSISYVLHQDENFDFEQSITPEFPYRDNHIITRYAAASYTDGSIEYSTYLSNYDIQWSSWNDDHSREFARLKEGHYDFMVKARNSYGKQSQPLVFSFVILPPWYRSILAKIVYLAIIIILIVLLIYFFNKRVEANRRVEIQKQKEKYRIREEQLNNEALKVEQELVRMKNEKLRNEMLYKEKELANSAMNILQKNKALIKIKNRMLKIKMLSNNPEVKDQMDQLIRKINYDIDSEDYWNVFEVHLEQVHQDFLKRLNEKHPDLNYREQKLCAYIRMGMSSKEIAALINISFRAVENNRYRLRQKLDLAQGENLSHYINSL